MELEVIPLPSPPLGSFKINDLEANLARSLRNKDLPVKSLFFSDLPRLSKAKPECFSSLLLFRGILQALGLRTLAIRITLLSQLIVNVRQKGVCRRVVGLGGNCLFQGFDAGSRIA